MDTPYLYSCRTTVMDGALLLGEETNNLEGDHLRKKQKRSTFS